MYDSSKTRSLLTMAGGFANFPAGDYIADLAKQLTEAEAEITLATNAKLKAEGEANRYAAELATMQSAMRQLREENEALKSAVPAPESKRLRSPRPVASPEPAPAPAPDPGVAPTAAKAKAHRKPKTETPTS